MGPLPDAPSARGSGVAQPMSAADMRPRLRAAPECGFSGHIAAAQTSAEGRAQRRQQRRVPPSRCSGAGDAGPPVAALSQDADAEERKEEYNRRMQQRMGWEDANPYEYHYGACG